MNDSVLYGYCEYDVIESRLSCVRMGTMRVTFYSFYYQSWPGKEARDNALGNIGNIPLSLVS